MCTQHNLDILQLLIGNNIMLKDLVKMYLSFYIIMNMTFEDDQYGNDH